METQTAEAPVLGVQIEAIKKVAEGFNKADFNGRLHSEVAESVARNIVIAEEEPVKVEGLKVLGNYASATGRDWEYVPQVQEKVVDQIAAIGQGEPSIPVKGEALTQIARRFDKADFNGRTHGQAVDAMRKVASSVTVTEQNSPQAELVNKAIDRLGAYASATGRDWEYVPQVQSKARAAIDYISATAGVAKLTDLKP